MNKIFLFVCILLCPIVSPNEYCYSFCQNMKGCDPDLRCLSSSEFNKNLYIPKDTLKSIVFHNQDLQCIEGCEEHDKVIKMKCDYVENVWVCNMVAYEHEGSRDVSLQSANVTCTEFDEVFVILQSCAVTYSLVRDTSVLNSIYSLFYD